MSVPYDKFTEAFLAKVTEFDFIKLSEYERNHLIDGYMKRAIAAFKKVCKYDLTTTADRTTMGICPVYTYDDTDRGRSADG